VTHRVGFFFEEKGPPPRAVVATTAASGRSERRQVVGVGPHDNMIDVGILGATGMVGQQFIALLAKHPWFRVTWLGASHRSEGKAYQDACAWRLPAHLPDEVAKMGVDAATPGRAPKLVFSGLDSSVAGEIEGAFAAAGHLVISNSRNYRMETDVPLLVPEINADHLSLLDTQAARGWKGRIVTNPNCSTVVLTMALAPLRQFGLKTVLITTMQAISGAGYPGVASWDILGNVIPFIDGEEQKIETETKKILGTLVNGSVTPHAAIISASTTRVPVHDGHTESVAVGLEQKPTPEAVIEAIQAFKGKPQQMGLPSAPAQPVVYLHQKNRPQPSLDVHRDGGMTVSVGRLRACSVLDYKFIALGHNTIRGAAGAAILNAELMHKEGLL
jgi:aspartate-semialdehyde dehydrogenase